MEFKTGRFNQLMRAVDDTEKIYSPENFMNRGPDKILEDEAYRIMSKLPQVKPGEYLGKKVNILYGLPISFRL